VVVAEFDIAGVSFLPDETDAPLVVDADGMLAGASPFERFEPVAGRNAQVLQSRHGVDQEQLDDCSLRDIRWDRSSRRAEIEALSHLVLETPDHEEFVLVFCTIGKVEEAAE
jgi:hypothetical protein